MILVYHAKDPTFGLTRKIWPDDYELVARINTGDIEEAYYLTQHLDFEWWKNKKVDLVKKSRSTSVGDVLVDVTTGDILLVENIGFSVIGKLNPYSPRIIERTQKEARELFDTIMELGRSPRPLKFEYNDLVAERIAFHLDSSDKNKLISIPEKLIYVAMNELEKWKSGPEPVKPYLLEKIDLTLDTYRKFLRLPLSHYRRHHQWTEWD